MQLTELNGGFAGSKLNGEVAHVPKSIHRCRCRAHHPFRRSRLGCQPSRRSGSDFTAATAGTFATTDASAAAATITVLEAHSKATPGASVSWHQHIVFSKPKSVGRKLPALGMTT